MARGVNKVILIGNLGSDPEVRYTPSGAAVANVNLATTSSWNDREGQRQERTEWHRLVFWNKLAEIVKQYLKKGSKVYVEGRLQTDTWEKEGQKHYTTQVVVSEMQMLDGRDDGAMGGGMGGPQGSAAPGGGPPAGGGDYGEGGGGGGMGGPQGGAVPGGGSPAGGGDSEDDDLPF